MTTPMLHAEPRTDLGRRAARLRRSGKIPAVVYGHGFPARAITLAAPEFLRLHRTAGEATLLDLVVDADAPVKALIQDVAHDPVTGAFLHVDFRAVSMTEEITTRIPLRFTGVPAVVANGAGVLVKHVDHLEVDALPSALVHEIVVDCSGLVAVDAALHVRDLVAPPGITFSADPSEVVVSVTAVQAEAEAPAAENAAAEVPVVGKEGKAAEGAAEEQ